MLCYKDLSFDEIDNKGINLLQIVLREGEKHKKDLNIVIDKVGKNILDKAFKYNNKSDNVQKIINLIEETGHKITLTNTVLKGKFDGNEKIRSYFQNVSISNKVTLDSDQSVGM